MIPIFTATGLILFYCACIPVKFALALHIRSHAALGAGVSLFCGRRALRSAVLRARGEKNHWPWKNSGVGFQKKDLYPALLSAAKHLLTHCRLEQLRLEGSLSLSDASRTALLCGSLHMLQGTIAPFVPSGSLHLQPRPDFSGAVSNALLSGMIRVPAGHIMLAALKGAWQYLKSIRSNAHGKSSH